MLAVTSIAGNIFTHRRLSEKYRDAKAAGEFELLSLSRLEMERIRLRRRTDHGTDVGLVLEPGSRLHHGDVLAAQRFIVVEQLPEKVVTIGIKKGDSKNMVKVAVLIGHTIGNRHRPIAVDHGTISFPIQTESEVEIFRRLLPAGVTLKVKDQLFIPEGETHTHE